MVVNNDDIAAIATAHGVGAIGVIRVSGNTCIAKVDALFKGANLLKAASHTLHYGFILDGEKTVDEVVISLFKAPKSFTTEDSVEISCHGSPFILEQVMQVLLKNDIRLANPGEFTMRAFLNGRIDLSQAEAVADLIASNSEAAQQVALQQMKGGFSTEIAELREQLIHFAAMIELELDFAEEDVEFADRNQLVDLIEKIEVKLNPLIESFKLGNAIKHGVNTVIAGRPNAGKSTLLNALLNEERAIVSDIAGTTRDTIEEVLNIKGIQFRLIDTAGIREATDQIEAMGVEKTLNEIEKSSLLIYVFDITTLSPEEVKKDIQALHHPQLEIIAVANKMDQNPYSQPDKYASDFLQKENIVATSALNKMNIEALKETLYNRFYATQGEDQTIVTNLRHFEALRLAMQALGEVKNGIAIGISGDLMAHDIKEALKQLGNITGEIDLDTDILGKIFSEFCIGK